MKEFLERSPWWPYIATLGVVAGLLIALVIAHREAVIIAFVVFIIAMMVVGVLLYRRLQSQEQAARGLEDSISSQADTDIERSIPGTLAEAENQRLKDELLKAFAALKSASRTGQRALAELPWYMVLGGTSSGKSEMIKRSGIEFLLRDGKQDPKAVRGVGGTRGFSWWLAKDAVLLDMSGRAMATADFDDDSDWLAFLKELLRNRPQRPINGVLVVVAVDQIADQPEAKIDSMARTVRDRIDELERHLGVWFPVYVLFNRCDQIAGFNEFFLELTPEDRRAAWGATVVLRRATSTPPQRIFDEEMDLIVGALRVRRMDRVAALQGVAERGRAFAFPLQLERVRGSMRRYIRTLFDAGKGPTAAGQRPFLRGFYLCASAQEGEPVDRVLQPAVQALGLEVPGPQGFAPSNSNAWFVQKLLQEIVFRDARLGGTSRGQNVRIALRERILIGVSALVWLAFTFMVGNLSCANQAVLEHAKVAAREVKENVNSGGDFGRKLVALDRLAASVAEVDSLDAHVPWGRFLGGWSGGDVRRQATNLWVERLAREVLAPACRTMQEKLRAGAGPVATDTVEYFYTYQSLALLTAPDRMEPADSTVLAHGVLAALRAELRPLGGGDRRGPDGVRVRRQLALLVRHGARLDAIRSGILPDPPIELMRNAAGQIADQWAVEPLVEQIVREIGDDTPTITLKTLVPDAKLLSGGATVSGAYAENAWNDRASGWFDALDSGVKRNDLLQAAFARAGKVVVDLRGELRRAYFARYVSAWAAFLDGAQFDCIPNNPGVSSLLGSLAGEGSELDRLLASVEAQTSLAGVQPGFSLLGQYTGAGEAKSADLKERLRRSLEWLTRNSRDKDKPAGKYRRLLRDAQSALGHSDVPEKGPTGHTKIEDDVEGYETFLRGFDPGIEAHAGNRAVIALLKRPLQPAIEILVKGVVHTPQGITGWADLAGTFSAEIQGRYPFSPGSAQEVSRADFEKTFGPSGLAAAVINALSAYMDQDANPKGMGALPVSHDTQVFLQRCARIRRAFFATGAQAGISFHVHQENITQNGLSVPKVTLDVGGKVATFYNGVDPTDPIVWPGTGNSPNTVLQAQARTQGARGRYVDMVVVPIDKDGLWSLFRLLDAASSRSTTGQGVRATWTLRANESAKFEVPLEFQVDTLENPFAPDLFKGLALPSSP